MEARAPEEDAVKLLDVPATENYELLYEQTAKSVQVSDDLLTLPTKVESTA